MTPLVAAYDQVVAELIGKARNAAARNKPTMWAYYLDAAEGLMDAFDTAERTDEDFVVVALSLSLRAELAAPNLNAIPAARLWALGTYARRIMRLAGLRHPAPSLAWLRERATLLVDPVAT